MYIHILNMKSFFSIINNGNAFDHYKGTSTIKAGLPVAQEVPL